MTDLQKMLTADDLRHFDWEEYRCGERGTSNGHMDLVRAYHDIYDDWYNEGAEQYLRSIQRLQRIRSTQAAAVAIVTAHWITKQSEENTP